MDPSVRAAFVALLTPSTNSYLCVSFIDEPFAIEAIIAKTAMKTFDIIAHTANWALPLKAVSDPSNDAHTPDARLVHLEN